eukprot:TRINITY_DN2848_c0_g1_i1.p2 TRINITY_DN2848_c0_g1~~TRINITY_DN2848_c0_g1_i1.p2  ORF type:complete len:243 (-),score=22.91 TRINITY_DN2848_c0_g1_i1:420-1148(-)
MGYIVMQGIIFTACSLIFYVAVCEVEESSSNSNDTLKIMPLSMQNFGDSSWPTGMVITYREEDEKHQQNCLTIGELLQSSSQLTLIKAVMDRLGVLEELQRQDIPNFTLLTPTNEAVIQFIKRLQQRKNTDEYVDFTNATEVANYLKVDQWDSAISLMILPQTWSPFKRIMNSASKMGTLMHRESFFWKFRKLDDGTTKLRFESKKKDEAIEEVLRPVLVGIVYKDVRTCNGWMQVVDSMPF